MFKLMQPHLIRLQRTNGLKPITVCYGESPIELGSMPFYNYQNRNSYAGDDTATYCDYYTLNNHHTQNIKMQATVHVIKLQTEKWCTAYDVNNIPNVTIQPAYTENNLQTGGISIPNFNDVNTSTNFIDFIASLKSKKLSDLLTKIYYYVTHGDTPYANVKFQTNYTYVNSFISTSPESDYVIRPESTTNYERPHPNGNNYPQCALLSDDPICSFEALPFVNTEPYSRMNMNNQYNTFPSLGIFFYGLGNDYQDYTHIYWTTYKGI